MPGLTIRETKRLEQRAAIAAAGAEARRRWRELLADIGNDETSAENKEEQPEDSDEDDEDNQAADDWWKEHCSSKINKRNCPVESTEKKDDLDGIQLARKILSISSKKDDDFAILSLIIPVTKYSTQLQLERAYKRLALKIHPDKLPHFEAATRAFQIASEAHDRQQMPLLPPRCGEDR